MAEFKDGKLRTAYEYETEGFYIILLEFRIIVL